MNIKEHTGTDIMATISNIGKVFMKAQLFDTKAQDSLRQSSTKEDINSIFVSSNEAINLTKALKKSIKKYKEDNPEIAKQIASKRDLIPLSRYKTLIDKTNQELTKNIKSKNASNKNIIRQSNNFSQPEENEDDLDKLNFDDIEENKHFNDGLSELSQDLEKEKENFKLKLVNEENVFANFDNIHSEMDEMVTKFMSIYQEKANR